MIGQEGILSGYEGNGGEVAEMRRRISELEVGTARLRAITSGFEGFLYVCSRNYRIEFMNERLVRRTGYDATGGICYEALQRRDSPCPWCENERVFKGETVRWEIKGQEDDRWYYVINAPLSSPEGFSLKQSIVLDITELKQVEESLIESERMLRARLEELTESNNSLKVLTRRMEDEKRGAEERIVSNVKNLVLPYVKKLKKQGISSEDLTYLNVIEGNLKEIISPLSHRTSSGLIGLTPKEVQIAYLIKEGKQNKEMAEELDMSLETVKSHRQNMRKKLGLYNRKANLRSFLLSHLK